MNASICHSVTSWMSLHAYNIIHNVSTTVIANTYPKIQLDEEVFT